ncbi:MAG: ABC transporter permease [Terriglobia bacterium]
MKTLLQDFRYGLRQLRRSPGFTAVVVATLALGIGANTAMFSVVNAVLLRPLPFRNPSRLVTINGVYPLTFTAGAEPKLVWEEWGRGTSTLEDISVYVTGELNWAGRGRPADVSAAEVSEDFFQLLGVRPIRGRTFLPAEEGVVPADVAVLSYQFWKAHYGLSSHVLGQTIRLNGKPFTVTGKPCRGG